MRSRSPSALTTSGSFQTEIVPDFAMPTIDNVRDARAHFTLLNKLETKDQKFDLIIIDCGPVTCDRMARYLAHVADEIILVARAGKTRLEDLHDAVDALGVAANRFRGVILNEVRG